MRMVPVLFLATGLMLLSGIGVAAERVALLIGNGDYDHLPALANAGADVTALGHTFEGLGFDVTIVTDADMATMRDALQGFARAAEGATIAAFYYTGHGLQIGGTNLLVPADASLEGAQDVPGGTLRLDAAMAAASGAGKSLIFLDASRNNPFGGDQLPLPSEGEAGSQVIMVFATAPGATIHAGTDGHSPFAAALLKHLDRPGIDLESIVSNVRTEVYKATGDQTVWSNSTILGGIVLKE